MHTKTNASLALDHDISKEALDMAQYLRGNDGETFTVYVHEAPSSSVHAFMPQNAVAGASDVQPVMLHGKAGSKLTGYATKIGANYITTGSHHFGIIDYFPGSTASRMLRHAPCSA